MSRFGQLALDIFKSVSLSKVLANLDSQILIVDELIDVSYFGQFNLSFDFTHLVLNLINLIFIFLDCRHASSWTGTGTEKRDEG